jgi:predicted TIM-barrel fold metal-dependent hydrolase
MGRVMRGLMAVAEKHQVPITIHVEVTRLREFEALLEAFPDVTVIMAHGGYAPLFIARRLLEAHPNLIFELSARTWIQHPRSPDYTILKDGAEVWPEWLSLISELPDRFVVGTDATARSGGSDLGKISSVRNLLSQLDPSVRDQVARGNMLRLIGVPGPG